MLAQHGELRPRRDVQHMDARPRRPRDRDQPPGAAQRRLHVAPQVVARRVARHAQRLALGEPRLVLGMEGGAPARAAEDRGDTLVVGDEQRPGRGAHEHLDAGGARQALQLGDVGGVLPRSTDPEGEVAMHAVARPRHLVGERRLARGERIGVGHLEHGGDAAEHRRPRAGFEVLLVGQAGLAEMHLGVDDAGQEVEAAGVDLFARARAGEVADRADSPAGDADVAHPDAVVVDQRAAFDEEVVGVRHGRLRGAGVMKLS